MIDNGSMKPLPANVRQDIIERTDGVPSFVEEMTKAVLETQQSCFMAGPRGIDGYVAPGRAQHPTAANGKVGGPLTQLMRKKIDDGGFETPYRLRKQVVEPVFGQIKQARGFRQFLLRGVKKVRAEWALICTTHNLLKLFTLAKAA